MNRPTHNQRRLYRALELGLIQKAKQILQEDIKDTLFNSWLEEDPEAKDALDNLRRGPIESNEIYTEGARKHTYGISDYDYEGQPVNAGLIRKISAEGVIDALQQQQAKGAVIIQPAESTSENKRLSEDDVRKALNLYSEAAKQNPEESEPLENTPTVYEYKPSSHNPTQLSEEGVQDAVDYAIRQGADSVFRPAPFSEKKSNTEKQTEAPEEKSIKDLAKEALDMLSEPGVPFIEITLTSTKEEVEETIEAETEESFSIEITSDSESKGKQEVTEIKPLGKPYISKPRLISPSRTIAKAFGLIKANHGLTTTKKTDLFQILGFDNQYQVNNLMRKSATIKTKYADYLVSVLGMGILADLQDGIN